MRSKISYEHRNKKKYMLGRSDCRLKNASNIVICDLLHKNVMNFLSVENCGNKFICFRKWIYVRKMTKNVAEK